MAKPISAIESHPQRHRIIEALLNGESLRAVSAWTNPPVTPSALSRFKLRGIADSHRAIAHAKVATAIEDKGIDTESAVAATKAALLVAADPFLAHVVRQNERRGRMMTLAERDENHTAYSSHDRNDIAATKLHAELAGRLTSSPLIAVQVVIPATGPARIEDDETGETIDIR